MRTFIYTCILPNNCQNTYCFIRTELNVLICENMEHLTALSFCFGERGADGVVGEGDGRERRKEAKEVGGKGQRAENSEGRMS